jgi:hypothetical protein
VKDSFEALPKKRHGMSKNEFLISAEGKTLDFVSLFLNPANCEGPTEYKTRRKCEMWTSRVCGIACKVTFAKAVVERLLHTVECFDASCTHATGSEQHDRLRGILWCGSRKG